MAALPGGAVAAPAPPAAARPGPDVAEPEVARLCAEAQVRPPPHAAAQAQPNNSGVPLPSKPTAGVEDAVEPAPPPPRIVVAFLALVPASPPLAAADPFVLSLALKACAAAADAGHAASLHAFAVRSSAVSSVFVATALADAYAKAGRLTLALRVFDEMPRKNVVSWTTLVAALARAGRRHDALRRFTEMRASGMCCD